MLLEVKNLSKVYGYGASKTVALKNVNFSIDKGEFVAIMGPSGSGKSTLMNILGCLDKPSAGSYRLENREIGRLSDNELAEIRNKKIGFVFQTFNLLPRADALANVELPMIYSGIPRRKRVIIAREYLESVGLGNRIHYKPNQMSGGQRQRVAIARALVNNPSLLLADEPTGNLDSRSGEEVMSIFKRLNEIGVTVLVITHDQTVADFTRRIIHIKDGTVTEDESRELKQ